MEHVGDHSARAAGGAVAASPDVGWAGGGCKLYTPDSNRCTHESFILDPSAILKFQPMHIKKQRLLTPGPTPLYPKALQAMMGADIHHRTQDFRDLYLSMLADLKT